MSKVMTLELKPETGGVYKSEIEAFPDMAVEYFEAKKDKWEKRCTEIEGARFDDLIPGHAFGAQLPTGYKVYYELDL